MRLKKQKYYESLEISKITDNKTFWKALSPLFSNKSYSTNSRVTLLENGEILSEESKVADTFNKFFSKVVKELKIGKKSKKATPKGDIPVKILRHNNTCLDRMLQSKHQKFNIP